MREVSALLGADIRTVNMLALTSGVLHTKFWVVDKKHVYIGSANMDWRSLTQVDSTKVPSHTFLEAAYSFYCMTM